MTKKDYIAIAGMLAETLVDINRQNNTQAGRLSARFALHHFARQFCNHAIDDNSRFDTDRFMAACQWETT